MDLLNLKNTNQDLELFIKTGSRNIFRFGTLIVNQ